MKKKCAIETCKRQARKNGLLCDKCRYEKRKQDDPQKWAWTCLRTNARRRRKPCTITLEEFREFCYETDILHGRGRTSTSYHIDCIIDELGYVKGNLQRLTNRENIQKEHERRRKKKVVVYDYLTKTGSVIEVKPNIPDPNVPF